MRVLLTNARLESWYGSEMYLLDVARWLRERGHDPIAYSARLGRFGQAMRRDGFAVVDDPSEVGPAPDMIHAQHHLATVTALTAFPNVPAVALCHGARPWEEQPLFHPQIRRYVAVSGLTRERLLSVAGIDPGRVRVIPNFVDTVRFTPRRDLPPRPRRALLFSNHAAPGAGWVEQVREACSRHGIALNIVGAASGNASESPESILGDYDLVFARGRAALEAMATGAAVIVCDIEGLASFVTPDKIDELREGNFGVQVMRRPNERDIVAAEIDRYDRDVARETSHVVRMTLSRDVVVPRLFETYREAIVEAAERPVASDEANRAVATYLRSLDLAAPMPRDDAERVVVDLRKELAAARHNYATFRSRFLVQRLLPVLWRTRKLVAPTGSRRYKAYMRLRSLGHTVLAPVATVRASAADSAPPAELASSYPPDASLAVVVMDVGGQPGLVDAVQSLLVQEPPPEIVVVSSGGNAAEGLLRAAGLKVDVVQTSNLLMPGAARNLGIAATSAPHVAFLAADCIAAPGWVAGRLAAHAAGAQAVSSAVVNDAPRNPFAVASHALLYSPRLPSTPRRERLHYGASYERALFRRYGRFSDDLRIGEDTDFHARLTPDASWAFRPDVRAVHRNAHSLRQLLSDHFARGARAANVRQSLYAESAHQARSKIARNALERLPSSVGLAWRAGTRRDRVGLIAATPVLLPAVAAYAAGAALSPRAGGASAAAHGQERTTSRRLLALLQFKNEARHLEGYVDNLGPLVDGIIALDDGSTDSSADILRSHPSVIEVLRLSKHPDKGWEEPRNRRILMDAAIRHGAEWVVVVDADERLERRFRERAEEYMTRGEREGIYAYAIAMREMWGSEKTYRVDGIWGQKAQPRLFRVPAYYDTNEMALHGPWAPENTRRPNGGFERADLQLYHLAMITPGDRENRKQKYKRLDPESRWQSIGYDYLTDETGLKLEDVPEDRGFRVTIPS